MASTSWKEQPTPGGDARFAMYAQRMVELQRRHGAGGALRRGLHAKGHGLFEATLEILPDVTEHARESTPTSLRPKRAAATMFAATPASRGHARKSG